MKYLAFGLFGMLLFSGCVTEPTYSETVTISDSPSSEMWKEAVIVEILRRSPELNSHRFLGETENTVYVHENGTEAVFSPSGEIVTNPENKGSYNYYHPEKRPIAHYMSDIKPWLYYGNDRLDSTTKTERLDAYAYDLAIGIMMTLEERPVSKTIDHVSFDSPEELGMARKWVRSFEGSDVISIFDLYENGNEISYDRAVLISKSIIENLP